MPGGRSERVVSLLERDFLDLRRDRKGMQRNNDLPERAGTVLLGGTEPAERDYYRSAGPNGYGCIGGAPEAFGYSPRAGAPQRWPAAHRLPSIVRPSPVQ